MHSEVKDSWTESSLAELTILAEARTAGGWGRWRKSSQKRATTTGWVKSHCFQTRRVQMYPTCGEVFCSHVDSRVYRARVAGLLLLSLLTETTSTIYWLPGSRPSKLYDLWTHRHKFKSATVTHNNWCGVNWPGLLMRNDHLLNGCSVFDGQDEFAHQSSGCTPANAYGWWCFIDKRDLQRDGGCHSMKNKARLLGTKDEGVLACVCVYLQWYWSRRANCRRRTPSLFERRSDKVSRESEQKTLHSDRTPSAPVHTQQQQQKSYMPY